MQIVDLRQVDLTSSAGGRSFDLYHSRSLNLDPEHLTVAILQAEESYGDTPASKEHDAMEMLIRTLHSLLVSVCLFTLSPLIADQGRVADYSFRVVGVVCRSGRCPSADSRRDYKMSRTSPVTNPVTTSSRARKYQSAPLPPTRESSSPASFSTLTFAFNETAGDPTPARRLLIRVA